MELSSPLSHAERRRLEGALWVLTAPEGNPNYDFRFDAFFRCRRSWGPPPGVPAVARVGAIARYPVVYEALRGDGITLLHGHEQHLLASELPHGYPLLADLTPRSRCFSGRPDAKAVGTEFGWPIFLKGSRQTGRHRRALSVIEGPEEFERALDAYAEDPLLR
jgi:hypothetical protein